MLPAQKISERLKETQRFYEPKPPTLLIWFWHIMNGSMLVAIIALYMSLSTFIVASLYELKDNSDLFFAMGFLAVFFTLAHLSVSRQGYVRVSESTVAAAQALEKIVNEKQLEQLMRLTRFLRILHGVILVEFYVHVVAYWIIPLWRNSLLAPMPYLPGRPLYFWSMYLVQSVVLTMGPTSAFSLLVYHLEVSVCLTRMFNVLGEHFKATRTQANARESIRVHQLLLNASKIFQQVFSVVWFSVIFALLAMLIVITYILIGLSFEIFLLTLIATFFCFLCEPCILGEMVTTSSENIGPSVYESDWVVAVPPLRRDLSLVILRSQKPVHITAGMIGTLNLRKLMSFMNNWYKVVQALLNLK